MENAAYVVMILRVLPILIMTIIAVAILRRVKNASEDYFALDVIRL